MEFKNLTICDHPLISHKIAYLRSVDTKHKEFRELVQEITTLMTYEALRDIKTKEKTITTPLETITQTVVDTDAIMAVPILRAGLGMLDGFIKAVPSVRVGFLGMARDEQTLCPKEYYSNITQNVSGTQFVILDPMLATGGSAAAAITFLKNRKITNIKLMCIISAPEGVKRIEEEHPDIKVYTAVLDRCLNEHGFILPGLGDAGDRLFC